MMSTRNIVVDVSPGTRGCVRLYFAREYVRYPLGNDPQYFTVCECDDDRNDGRVSGGARRSCYGGAKGVWDAVDTSPD